MSDLSTLLNDLQDYSSQKAISDLLGAGVDEAFVKPLMDILKKAVFNGAGMNDVIQELQQFMNGKEGQLGTLEKYLGQVTSDSLAQYTANYTEVVTQDLGLEFYKYSGNIQSDTRCFCKERVNLFFHRKEIEAWGEGKVTAGGVKSCGFPWAGMIKGTNASTIFTFRGGWNCEHYIISVSTISVPKEVIMRNIRNGNYSPTSEIKKYFGL